jgi:DNA-binding SARP family transcriptional activator
VVRFNILGPIVLEVNGRHLDLKGMLRRVLLVALLVTEGGFVTPESLMEELWGTAPPPTAVNALQANVSRLRRNLLKLEPERPQPRLQQFGGGYRLFVYPGELDATMFVEAVDRVRGTTELPAAEVVRRLRSALSLWHGEPFEQLPRGRLIEGAAARYLARRAEAHELLFDHELQLGRHSAILADLAELVSVEPLNERLCEQFMVALYRSGRQTDALALFRQMRFRLNDELGVEPSPTLRTFERAILAHDPILAVHVDHRLLRTDVA